MSARSLFKHALSTCLCCFLLTISIIYSANAAVCFLPEGGNCSNGGDKGPTPIPCDTDCIYNNDKGEGWDCEQCDCTAGRWKCEKSTCPEGYSTDVDCNDPNKSQICEGKSGSAQCCKCEDNSTRCQHEGYAYKKTTNNKCRNQCPYDSNYYEECWCENKYDLTSTEKCYAYETCEVGDLANTKKYQKTNDLHKNCAEKGYVTKNSPQYTSNDYTCGSTPICTECDDVEYYQCTPKISCNASEGKYETEELCVTAYRNSTQHASVLDWFEKVINDFSLIPTCYAANLDHEACWYCKTDPNPSECYKACSPQAQVDDPITNLCPIDPVKNCVACTGSCNRQGYPCCVIDNPITGCIGMAMEYDQNCVYCKTDDPTYRAPGCEGYPCCDITPTIPCRIDPEKNCALCSKGCDRKEYPCCLKNPEIVDPDPNPDVPESPCELKDGCWVVKTPNSTCNPDEGMYEREGDCKNMGWSCAKEGNCWKRTNAEITYARSDTCNPVLIVQGSATTVTITSNDSNHKFIDAGNNELTFGLFTGGIPSSFKIEGPDGTTTLTATVTGSTGTIGTYNFKAGKSYQVTPNCNGDDCSSMVTLYQSQCESWGGTLKYKTSPVIDDECHAVFGDCGGKYYYCLPSSCPDPDDEIESEGYYCSHVVNAESKVDSGTLTIPAGTPDVCRRYHAVGPHYNRGGELYYEPGYSIEESQFTMEEWINGASCSLYLDCDYWVTYKSGRSEKLDEVTEACKKVTNQGFHPIKYSNCSRVNTGYGMDLVLTARGDGSCSDGYYTGNNGGHYDTKKTYWAKYQCTFYKGDKSVTVNGKEYKCGKGWGDAVWFDYKAEYEDPCRDNDDDVCICNCPGGYWWDVNGNSGSSPGLSCYNPQGNPGDWSHYSCGVGRCDCPAMTSCP